MDILTEVLTGLLGIAVGLIGGLGYAHTTLRSKLESITNTTSTHTSDITNLVGRISRVEKEAALIRDRTAQEISECRKMHLETLELVSANVHVNNQVLAQNNMLVELLSKKHGDEFSKN